MLKIWGRHTSINVQKVLWTCAELELPYERVDVGGAFGGLDTPSYRRLNPNGRIPVMEDDGFILWESNSIVRYLCASHAMGTLCPSSTRHRADAERWMDWQLCHILPGMVPLFFGLVRKAPEHSDPNTLEQARLRTEQAWAILNEHLATRQYVLGTSITMADIPLGTFAYRWLNLPMQRATFPHIEAWYRRLCDRPGYKKHVMLPLQ